MNNPHPFYRFGSAWNTGFYPQNQVASNQLNDIYVELGSWLPSYWPGKTIDQLYAGIKALVAPYNDFPVFGNFTTTITKIPDTPVYEYNIDIRDVNLSSTDSNQVVTINGFYNAITKIVTGAILESFTVGSYSGTFDPAHVSAEDEGINALSIANDYGSANFPLYYSYDSTSGIATSVLARARSYQLSSGAITRIPADTLAKENARRFTLDALSAEDKFAVTFLERIINASIGQSDPTAIANAYNSLDMPQGWIKLFSYNPTTYPRIQVTLSNPSGRVLAMVGRLDGSWTWQRFINEVGENDSSILINSYSATTQLPYEPTSGSRYIYFDTWYDFDFCDFTPDCFVSPEFYAMPAIPGDIYQFNVPTDEGNLTSLTSVQVGLFQEDGGFIQKIGKAEKDCSFTLNLPYLISPDTNPSYQSWNDFIDTYVSVGALSFVLSNQQINYTGTSANSTVNSQVGPTIATLPSGSVLSYDKQLFIDEVEALTFPANLKVKGKVINIDGEEVVQLRFYNFINIDYPSIQIQSNKYTEFDYFGFINSLCCSPDQFKATCTIPAVKDGCYRLGLYDEPGESGGGGGTCQLTFELQFDNPDFEFQSKNSTYPGNYFSWAIYDGTNYSQVFQCPSITPISPPFDVIPTVIGYAETIPGMSVFYDETTLKFTWTVTVDCGINYKLWFGIMDSSKNPVVLMGDTFTQNCPCEPVVIQTYSLYSLSNLININRADCFSTMLEFWADDNTIAQGFEYSNGWKQRVRIGMNGGGQKPIIEESLYRQSNGVHKRPQNKQDLSVDLHTDFFDLDTQLAMTDATRHPYLVWSGKPIFVKGDIEVATIQDFTTQSSFETLSQMKFQALIQGFQPGNSSCLTC